MIDLTALDAIEFHDLPVESILLPMNENRRLELFVTPYDESIKGYQSIQIVFDQLIQFDSSLRSIQEDAELEIYSFKYSVRNDVLSGRLVGLSGFGQPGFNIAFSCRVVTVKGI